MVSAEYRPAPEHPHPVPVEDCYRALGWTAGQAKALGVDPHRLAVGGISAGGGLAAATAPLAGTGRVPPHAAPARAADLSGLPAASVDVGELEVFRDECARYALRLAEAGVPAELRLSPGAFHGFDGILPQVTLSRRAAAEQVAALRRALGGC
ncbi:MULTISPECIES: alpha/beta hydrolase fold domain-containing protein [Streptomyces]|uniref:alpha/beta hydrolase n=1 Tax=Streptomyces TaxID=1883 RepID=UPI00292A56C0|nr:alpha/beta hydrolase fold domain-containing protein [Streptomyces odorifer]